MRRISLIAVILIFSLLSGSLFAECRLLMMVARNDNEKITTCEAYIDAFALLQRQAYNSYMGDGWGVVYYEAGSSYSGEGVIWFNPDDPEEFNVGNRYASWQRVWEDSLNYFRTAEAIRDERDTKILLAHVRQATFGAGNIPNPHPFVFETEWNTYSFAHNGSAPNNNILNQMRDVVGNLIVSNHWDYGRWQHLVESEVDSAVYFAFVMAHIVNENGDILRGMRKALRHQLMNHQGWSGKNFIFSDGYDAYAFRGTGTPGQGPSYRLQYRLLHKDSNRETAVVMTRLPAGPGIVEIELNELVCFPQYGSPIHFKDINKEVLRWQKRLIPPPAYAERYWTWNSFPVLDPNLGVDAAGVIETLTQNYEPTGSGRGFGTTIYVRDRLEASADRVHHSLPWDYGIEPLQMFDYGSGYKMLHNAYSDSTDALVSGELCPAEMTVTLQPGTDNWVGYWLLNSQTIQQALGSYLPLVRYVSGQDWSFHTMRSMICPTFPMEFGQMYNIRLVAGLDEDVEFSWHNSRSPERGRRRRSSRFFDYRRQPEYQVIDIEKIDNDENIIEIGVFADGKCVGATTIGEYPQQLLIYPQGYEGKQLQWRLYYGDNRSVLADHKIMIYDFAAQSYSESSLYAGENFYTLIKLAARGDDELEILPPQVQASVSPNPFNPGTTISLSIAEVGDVSVKIYNTKGQLVRTLYEGVQNHKEAFYFWDGKNDRGNTGSSGVYFYAITAGKEKLEGKMLMLR